LSGAAATASVASQNTDRHGAARGIRAAYGACGIAAQALKPTRIPNPLTRM